MFMPFKYIYSFNPETIPLGKCYKCKAFFFFLTNFQTTEIVHLIRTSAGTHRKVTQVYTLNHIIVTYLELSVVA